MVLLEQELNQNKKSYLVWILSISILVILVIFVYSEMKKLIADIEMIDGQLGDFSKMVGLDKLSMRSLMGFYGMEIGNILAWVEHFMQPFLESVVLVKKKMITLQSFYLFIQSRGYQ